MKFISERPEENPKVRMFFFEPPIEKIRDQYISLTPNVPHELDELIGEELAQKVFAIRDVSGIEFINLRCDHIMVMLHSMGAWEEVSRSIKDILTE